MTTTSAFATLGSQFPVPARALARCMVLGFMVLLPPAQAQTTVAGNVPGEFAVAPNGAASYRIPIQVPPGVAGMEPKLALAYSSQAGNGVMGVGWNIEGLSAITRCPQSMVSDGVRGSLTYTAQDRFCLDGQRLMLVNGSYGAADSEYRTEIDGFSRIRALGMANSNAVNGPASFVAQTKAGLTLEYGSTVDSQVEAQGKSVVRAWALSRMKDAKGNSVSFTYVENSTTSEHLLSSITYGNNSVRFTYEARSDAIVGVEAGSLIHVYQRLKETETRVGSNTVQRTKLSYSYGASTGRSRVQAITQCAADNTCLAPLTFNQSDSADLGTLGASVHVIHESTMGSFYAKPAPIVVGHTILIPPAPDVHSFPKFADLNGDGYIDVIYALTGPTGAAIYQTLGRSDGSFSAATLIRNDNAIDTTVGCTPELADLNSDGKVDLLYVCARATGVQVVRWLGNGDGTFQPYGGWTVNVTGLGSFAGYVTQVADINGDGIPDLLLTRADASGLKAYKWIGKGDGTFQAEALAVQASANVVGFTPQLSDFNGDGLPDLLYLSGDSAGAHVYWLKNNGDGSFTAPALALNSTDGGDLAGCVPQMADLNNDGNADLVYACAKATGAFLFRWLGNGDSTFQPASVGVSSTGLGSFLNYVPQLVDINGDGVLDVVFSLADKTKVSVYRWIGMGGGAFFDAGLALTAPPNVGADSLDGYTPMFVDLNGDGLPDLFYSTVNSSGGFGYGFPGKGVIPDRLNSISNGAGTTHQLSYKFTSDRSVYTKDAVIAYPRVELQAPTPVVSSMSQNNGLGGFNTTTYRYGNLAFEYSPGPGIGRGTLGFGWTLSEELVSGVKLYTEYRQDYPYVGSSHFAQVLVNGRIVKQTATTFDCTQTNAAGATTPCGSPAPGKVYFPFAANSTEKSWDLSGAALPIVVNITTFGGTADTSGKTWQLGDVTASKVELIDVSVVKHRKTTINQYQPANMSGSNWILGRLKRATVISNQY